MIFEFLFVLFPESSVKSHKLFKKIRSDFFGCRRTQIEVNLEKLVRSVCASRRKKRPNLFEEFMRLDTRVQLMRLMLHLALANFRLCLNRIEDFFLKRL